MDNQIVTSPLTNPSVLPLVPIESIAQSPVLVVAPHPDDETLGCGGAIALLNSLNCDVRVLVVSDGTRSHPRSKKYPASKLQKLRESETLAALNLLGLDAQNVTFLGLQDGSVLTEYQTAITNCCTFLTQINPQIIFLPWRYDPHPDHRGSWQLIITALSSLSQSPKIIEYPIWDWDEQQRGNVPESEKIKCWRLDINTVVEMKQQAISAYHSQITNLIDDDPEGFRLTPDMLANFARPWEVYMEFSKN
jgi:LmbE family N-acetylglucosaminyl deacetylase